MGGLPSMDSINPTEFLVNRDAAKETLLSKTGELPSLKVPGYPMRQPCPRCGPASGRLTPAGPHHKVACAQCGAYCYFAPRAEVEKWLH